MAMTPQLYTISGLSTELGRDRRTVAAALRGVPPDGAVTGGHPGWYLNTALGALSPPQAPAYGIHGSTDAVVGKIHDRLQHWRSIYARDSYDLPLPEAAELLQQTPAQILLQLRSGCPYAVAGDWATGAGFTMRMPWLIEWQALIEGRLLAAGAFDLIGRLGLDRPPPAL